MDKALTEDQARHFFYVKLTQALHAAAAECIEKNGSEAHLIDVLGQFKRFQSAIEKTAGSPGPKVQNYPE
jgi:hypothetical protein